MVSSSRGLVAGGTAWSAPLMAYRDHSAAQHGLVSMAASSTREASLFWHETPKGEDGPVGLESASDVQKTLPPPELNHLHKGT
jgi:hypothetical protein